MYRFVLSPRWLGFALFVILLAGVCVRLGIWQYDRHEQRKDDNEIVRAHLDEKPRPIDEVIGPDDDAVPDDSEWIPVRATGTYDTEHEVVEKYQTRDEGPGVDVVTPLVTESGTAVIVNRGWMSTPNNSADVDIPAPPAGPVTVTGWLRVDSGADAGAVEPTNGQVRAVSSAGMEAALPYDAYPGYLNRTAQEPAGDDGLEPEPRPDLGQGPNFFYSMQWFFFAALAVFGWFYFAWSEAHPRKRRVSRSSAETDVSAPASPEPGHERPAHEESADEYGADAAR